MTPIRLEYHMGIVSLTWLNNTRVILREYFSHISYQNVSIQQEFKVVLSIVISIYQSSLFNNWR